MEFVGFPKMARLNRQCIITEKIDGTNASIHIDVDKDIFLVGSRTRWITPESDNFGFARWAYEHRDELMGLGNGTHFGEWWGQGIQRTYGIKEKRFSLFNVGRWCLAGNTPAIIPNADPRIVKTQDVLPECCGLVPELYRGMFDTQVCHDIINVLRDQGSRAVPGFMKPEGIIVYHIAAGIGFKYTCEKDEKAKGE